MWFRMLCTMRNMINGLLRENDNYSYTKCIVIVVQMQNSVHVELMPTDLHINCT